MQYFKISLTAGVLNRMNVSGKYFRILSGAGLIYCKTDSGIDTEALAGIGMDWRNEITGEGFTWIDFKSDTTQEISCIASAFPTTDSRLTGDVDINGLLQVVSTGAPNLFNSTVTIPGAVAEIIAANTKRDNVVIIPDVDCYIGGSGVTAANSRKVSAGQIWKTSGTYAIYAVGAAGAGAANATFVESEERD